MPAALVLCPFAFILGLVAGFALAALCSAGRCNTCADAWFNRREQGEES